MTTKIHDLQTKRQKNMSAKGAHNMNFLEKVAAVCGCSTSMVRYVLNGKRNGETNLGERIWVSATLIADKENLLIQEIKKIVNL